MFVFQEYVCNASVHGNVACAFGVIPFDVHASKLGIGTGPVDGYSFRAAARWSAWRWSQYSSPKLSTIRTNMMGRHVWRHNLGVVAHW